MHAKQVGTYGLNNKEEIVYIEKNLPQKEYFLMDADIAFLKVGDCFCFEGKVRDVYNKEYRVVQGVDIYVTPVLKENSE